MHELGALGSKYIVQNNGGTQQLEENNLPMLPWYM
jgi:hypothetical protein